MTAIAIRALVNPVLRESDPIKSTSGLELCHDCIDLRPRPLPQSVFEVDVRSLCLGDTKSSEASPETDKPEVVVRVGLPDAADEITNARLQNRFQRRWGQPGGSQTRLRHNAQPQTRSPRRPDELSCPEGTPCLPSARI